MEMKSSWKLVFEHFRVKVENQVLRVQGPDLVEKTVKRLTLLMSLLVILDAKEDFKLAYAVFVILNWKMREVTKDGCWEESSNGG